MTSPRSASGIHAEEIGNLFYVLVGNMDCLCVGH